MYDKNSRKSPYLALVFVAATVLMLAGGSMSPKPVQAKETSSEGSVFSGPDGWIAMCRQHADLCNTDSRKVSAPAAMFDTVANVNRMVNQLIQPQEEMAGLDEWHIAPVAGDCDDYALTKKQRLIEAGIPASSIRFLTGFTEEGIYHVVLSVDLDGDTVVLDNRLDELVVPRSLEEIGYVWVGTEGLGDNGSWQLTAMGILLNALMSDHERIQPAAGDDTNS